MCADDSDNPIRTLLADRRLFLHLRGSLRCFLLLLCDFRLAVVPPAALSGCTSGGLQLLWFKHGVTLLRLTTATAATSYTHHAEEPGPILPPNGSTQAVASLFFIALPPGETQLALRGER